MSDASVTGASMPARTKARLGRTASISRWALGRPDSLVIVLAVATGYLAVFLYMIQDLRVHSPGDVGIAAVADSPLSTMFDPAAGSFMHQPIVVLELGIATWQFSPLNTGLGLSVAALVGLNIALTYLAIVQPRACGMGASAGFVAGVPALFAGGACCAPVIILIFGIQATGTLLTAIAWLLPVSLALLVLTLVYITGKISPTMG